MPDSPPPPPPPPVSLKNSFLSAPSPGGDSRSALLGQIQKGAQLKKVKTVDKTIPVGVGRVAEEAHLSNSQSLDSISVRETSETVTTSTTLSARNRGGFSNFTDELQFKLTLKKNKKLSTSALGFIKETKEVRISCTIQIFLRLFSKKNRRLGFFERKCHVLGTLFVCPSFGA